MTGIGACDPAGDNKRPSHQDHAAWTKDDGCSKERHRILITLRRGFAYAVGRSPDTGTRVYLTKTGGDVRTGKDVKLHMSDIIEC